MAQAVADIPLFKGLSDEQVVLLAGACSVKDFGAGTYIFREADHADCMYIVLSGKVRISVGTPEVGIGNVETGETLGELSMLSSCPHSATAATETPVEAAVLTHQDLTDLVRRRPDIGVMIYKNLAVGLGKKLLRSDSLLRDRVVGEPELLNLAYNLPHREQ